MTKSITLYDHEARAWQAGKLSLLLRPIKPQPGDHPNDDGYLNTIIERCPFPPGSYYVRETYADNGRGIIAKAYPGAWGNPIYKATFGAMLKPICEGYSSWRSPVTMPKWASRGNIEIVENKICRFRDLETKDIINAALLWHHGDMEIDQYANYFVNWDSAFGKDFPADSNPYIWRLPVKNGS